MSYFLSNQKLAEGKVLTLSEAEARHILASRRMKPGETFHLQGPDCGRHLAMLAELKGRGTLTVQVGPAVAVPPEPSLSLTLCQALVDEKALDLVLQKATELGAARVVVFHGDRSPYALPASKVRKKLERWATINAEAAKQCDRLHGAEVSYLKDLTETFTNCPKTRGSTSYGGKKTFPCLEQVDTSAEVEPPHAVFGQSVRVALSQHGTQSLASLLKKEATSVCIFIGPEGGWSEKEQELFRQEKISTATLGPRILRTETAAISTMTLVQSLLGDMR